jgi:tRNA threonylcarbamoyladenosine biosynthesis protein TsaB
MQLAIDTSTDIASIALSNQGEVIAELTWHCGNKHTVELLPNIVHLLHRAEKNYGNIDGVIVATGPGSFNGLRVGMSTAKGISFALGIPLAGISTLEAEAFPFAFTKLPIYPIHSAGRGEIATALFQRRDNEWRKLLEEHITTLDVLCSQARNRTIFCGELSSSIEAQLVKYLGIQAIIPAPTARLRRAGYLVELGWQRLKRGDFDDLATLEPLYLRRPAITQPKSKVVLQ